MSKPQLWVWIGSPEDKLDVMRYVKATDEDILSQPIVIKELDRLKRVEEEFKKWIPFLVSHGCLKTDTVSPSKGEACNSITTFSCISEDWSEDYESATPIRWDPQKGWVDE